MKKNSLLFIEFFYLFFSTNQSVLNLLKNFYKIVQGFGSAPDGFGIAYSGSNTLARMDV